MDALDSRLSAYEWQGNINFKESPTKSFDKIIYIEKAGNHIYGHWLVDILPRIHFLKKSGEFEDYQWLFSDTTPDFALRLLDQLGINSDNRVFYNANEEIVKANVLVVPSMLRWHSTFFEDTAEFYEQFISSFSLTPAKRSRKILISRQSWNKPFRRLVNFRELQSISEEYSYEVISPEQYPLEEQLRIFASAASVVGENSSALHNTLFSPSGTPTLSLQSEFNNNTIQSGIADLKKQSMGYIYGLPLSLPGYRGYKNLSNFFISPKLFRQALQKMERLL